MNCIICNKNIEQAGALFRVNPSGTKGIWACQPHMSQTDGVMDPEILRLVDIILER